MFYTVYKITNQVNGKIYIGVHQTNNLDDGYMGSGKVITRAHKKYGIENFTKEILHFCENKDDMFQMEAVLVNEDFVQDESTYNIKLGGSGGWDFVNENCGNQGIRLNTSLSNEKRSLGGKKGGKIAMERLHAKRKEDEEFDTQFRYNCSQSFKGKKHTDEVKQRIGIANSIHQKGEGNSQFGTMWIHHLEEKLSKSIPKEKFHEYESSGWLKGRKMKF